MQRRKIEHRVEWYHNKSRSLNVNKTKELIVDFRKGDLADMPVFIDGSTVEELTVSNSWTLLPRMTSPQPKQPIMYAIMKKAQ